MDVRHAQGPPPRWQLKLTRPKSQSRSTVKAQNFEEDTLGDAPLEVSPTTSK